MRSLIKENSVYIARKLCETNYEVVRYLEKNGFPPDYVYLNHNQGFDRDLNLNCILDAINDGIDQFIITGEDAYRKLALILADWYNDTNEISLDYLKRTITKSNVILLNGGLLPLKDLEVFNTPVISVEDLLTDTITRIYVVRSDSIKFDNMKMILEFTPKSKLGIIMDVQ